MTETAKRNQVIEQKIKHVLGSPLADHVSLGELSPRRLVLVTDSPVWSNRVRYQANTLLASLADHFDSRQPPRLEFKVLPERGQEPRRKRTGAKLSGAASNHLRAVADMTEGNEKLSEVLNRLASRAAKGNGS